MDDFSHSVIDLYHGQKIKQQLTKIIRRKPYTLEVQPTKQSGWSLGDDPCEEFLILSYTRFPTSYK